MSEENTSDSKEEVEYQSFAEFLEGNPPNQWVNISDVGKKEETRYGFQSIMNTPDIQLHCNHENCNGTRFFRCIPSSELQISDNVSKYIYITYMCSNCRRITKTFALSIKLEKDLNPKGVCYKFGKLPTFGPPVSPKLIKLIGPDRDDFLKGRRCENQGLGVGSFIYYRRVVENQKNRILEQIIKVSEKIGAPTSKIAILQNAIKETQFSKALKLAKPALPESLLINGHNPLALLHSALSEGVHSMNDEECLTIASSVRIVLGELSDRLSQALKDEAEITRALSHLINHKKANKAFKTRTCLSLASGFEICSFV